MYRTPNDAPTVPCSSCSQPTIKEETFFTNAGDVVCKRCHGFDAAHAQVERARVAQIEEGRAAGRIVGAIEMFRAESAAERNHADLHAIEGGGPLAAPPVASKCEGCGTPMSPDGGVYRPNGKLVCKSCSVRLDEENRINKRRYEKTNRLLALIAFGLVIAVGATIFYLGMRR